VNSLRADSVAVTVVTHNSRAYIRSCLESLLSQEHPACEVVIVDNDSRDGTLDAVKPFRGRFRLIRNSCNAGFAAAQNQAIAATHSAWVLTLNPDTQLAPDFIRELVHAGQADERVGSVCGKLRLLNPDLTFPAEPLLDSTGILFSEELRHFDRGWGEPDREQFDRSEYVFGSTGAAALYRRRMIDDISTSSGFFDPDFFAYREDADVAWRAQLIGWRCLYTPAAVGYHVRRVRPGRRNRIPAALNMHSVKNRFLMRIKNLTGPVWKHCKWAALRRDLLVIGGCVLTEPASLPAFWHLLGALPKAVSQRREIMARTTPETRLEVARWFGERDATPLPVAPALVSGARQSKA
jgi:GT2 family glycosyltransferase